jgi:hypothetical protein
MQNSDGSIGVTSSTVFGATGNPANVEATVFAVIAWSSNANQYATQIKNGISYVASQFSSDLFIFPFSAISAVNLITNYLSTYSGINGAGNFDLTINGIDLQQTSFNVMNQGVVPIIPSSNT